MYFVDAGEGYPMQGSPIKPPRGVVAHQGVVSCRTVTGWTRSGLEEPVNRRYEDRDFVDVGRWKSRGADFT